MLRPAPSVATPLEGSIEGEYRVVEKHQPSLHLH
jgi:hypothetical protein